MRSTIEFQQFDRVRLRSIGSIAEPVRLTSSGYLSITADYRLFIDYVSIITSRQPRIERSFELDILLKNFRMKQKKIDKDQRILPFTAIAIDC